MNPIIKLRKKIHNIIRERTFAKKTGIKNFKLIPGWMLRDVVPAGVFSSQCGQDWFVETYIFPGKKDGIFVDVGANHPLEINNSLFFERQGWTGIAFEPQDELCGLWQKLRRVPCLPYVLGAERKSVVFNLANEHTLSSVVSDHDTIGSAARVRTVEQYRLDEVLLGNNISHVDVLFIDVEGYEREVLQGMDFSKIMVTCVILENDRNRFGDDSIREHMKASGYRHVARLAGDDVFLKEGCLAGKKNFW